MLVVTSADQPNLQGEPQVPRLNPRTPQPTSDIPVIGSFGGLASASYSATGDTIYFDKLTNAYVTQRNDVIQRKGSTIVSSFAGLSQQDATNLFVYSFTFDNQKYSVAKVGSNIVLQLTDQQGNTLATITKTNVFSVPSEPATVTNVIEDDVCFVLFATTSTPLVSLCILSKQLTITATTSTAISANLTNYPVDNNLDNSNSLLFTSASYVPTTALSQSLSALSITTASPHGLTLASSANLHSVFYCYCRSAAYYPGSYCFSKVLRKNSVPLDVNCQLPSELVSNPLVNESKSQDLSIRSLKLYNTDRFTATEYAKSSTNQPASAYEWDFSDGGFISGNANLFTNRTPAYVSFGALEASSNPSYFFAVRLRELTVAGNKKTTGASVADLRMSINKTPTAPLFYLDSTGTVTSGSNARYFATLPGNRPSASLGAVVEVLYKSGRIVDLDRSAETILIGDGLSIPLYGYAAFAGVNDNAYPNIVLSVGNRVILSGYDNKVNFSNANWNYRGMSWNNFQVSTVDFQSTSAYSVALGQQSSRVIGIASVNGVIIAATNVGIFRLSGESPILPPTATTVNFSRLSNEVLPSADCLLVYEAKVFFVSSNGLFQLQYSRESAEVNSVAASVLVSDYFSLSPVCLTYSSTCRAFLISFRQTDEILAFVFESETWTTFKFSFAGSVKLTQALDGYQAVFADAGSFAAYVCKWTETNTDLANAATALLPSTIVNSRSLSVSGSPTPANSLVTPAELIETLDSRLTMAFGDNTVQTTDGSTVAVSEYSGGSVPAPILSYLVTKAFYPSKLEPSSRARAYTLLLTGSGTLLSKLVSDRPQPIETTIINSSGSVQQRANEAVRVVAGDTVQVRLRLFGITKDWQVALKLGSGLKLLGFQSDTSLKRAY